MDMDKGPTEMYADWSDTPRTFVWDKAHLRRGHNDQSRGVTSVARQH